MTQEIINRRKARRAIRKANRIARVDKRQPHRRRLFALLVALLLLFIAGEVFLVMHAMRISSQHRAHELAEQGIEQLNLISASFFSGDRTMLDVAKEHYETILAEMNHNNYMQRAQTDLLSKMNRYDEVLNDEDSLQDFLNLHLAVMMLSTDLSEVKLDSVSVDTLASIKNSYQDFDDSIAHLDGEEVSTIIKELQSYDKIIIENLQKAAVCIGVCPSKTVSGYQKKIDKAFSQHQEKLILLDRTISERYDPSVLVRALGMLE